MARGEMRLRAGASVILVVVGLAGIGCSGAPDQETAEASAETEEVVPEAMPDTAGDPPSGGSGLDDLTDGESGEGFEDAGGDEAYEAGDWPDEAAAEAGSEMEMPEGVPGAPRSSRILRDGPTGGRERVEPPPPPRRSPPPPAAGGAPRMALPPELVRALPPPEAAPVLVDRDLRYVTVFYGTNRGRGEPCRGAGVVLASTGGGCPPAEIYGGASEILEVGTLKVTFPPDHQRGQIERPMEIFGFQLRREDPDKDVVLAEVRSYGSDLDAWAADLRATRRQRALLYVHGFATTFETAAHTVAQISYDIEFSGLPMMYSWPSAGAVGDYGRDYDVVRLAVEPFQQFLRVAADQGELEEIHVVAHSMGNQLVGLAFREMALAGEELPALAQLVLAAPDVDAQEFRSRYAPRFPDLFRGVTVYVSDDDWALAASEELRSGMPRAGAAAGGLLTAALPGIEVIDATGLPADFLDHSYFAANDSVRSDLYCLIRAGVGASQRPLLDFADPSWRFKPADLRSGLDATVCPTATAGVTGASPAAASPGTDPPSPGTPGWLWWGGGLGVLFLVASGVWLTRRRARSV